MSRKHTSGTAVLCAAATLLGASTVEAATRKVCGSTSSGTGIVAVGPTSCPFARAVARKWERYGTVEVAPDVFGGPPKTIRVYSAASKRKITMRCRTHVEPDNTFGLCTGGNRARVEIRS